jgi:hypothetical protein
VHAVLPPDAIEIDEPQVGLVDERGRLERVAIPLAAHTPMRHPVQLRLDERHQACKRRLIARRPRLQQTGDVGGALGNGGFYRRAARLF